VRTKLRPGVRFAALSLLTVLLPGSLFLFAPQVQGAQFATRTLQINNNLVNATGVNYLLSFSGQSAGTVGSIRLQLCSNNPFPDTPCTAPSGLDVSVATLINQTGMTGFSIGPGTTANELILTRTPSASTSGTASYELQGVTNPNVSGTVFGRLETFATTDASGASTDASGLAIDIASDAVNVSTYVPPYILFCIGNTIQPYDCNTAQGNYIDFGELSKTQTAVGQTQLLIATNAEFGYTIRVLGTTLTSGIHTIPAMTTPDVSKVGTGQFGLNLRANTTPVVGSNVQGTGSGVVTADYDTPDYYKFLSGDVLVNSSSAENFRLFTVSYVANISANQAPGIYVSTLQYITLGTF